MKKQKIVLIITITLFLVVLAGLIFYVGVKKFNSKLQSAKPVQTIAVESAPISNPQAKPNSSIPADIQKIMNNNLTGTVTGISASSISIASNGISKTFNLTKNSFILTSGKLGNGKIANVKQGSKVYIQFDLSTNDALTITIE